MREFNKLCKQFEQLDVLSYTAILAEKSIKVLPALREAAGGKLDGAAAFATFIMGAIAADGRLSEEEYTLCYPLLYAFFGDSVNYDDCKSAARLLRSEGRELKKAVNDMVDIFGALSDELKDDIIIICMLICAVDGKISLKEKAWIKELIK